MFSYLFPEVIRVWVFKYIFVVTWEIFVQTLIRLVKRLGTFIIIFKQSSILNELSHFLPF